MNNEKNTFLGIGKRKTSVAKVVLKEGAGIIRINKKNFEDFFSSLAGSNERNKIKIPLVVANLTNQYDLFICVKGGGVNSQLDAISLAVANSVCKVDNRYRELLSKNLLLCRDSRIKERRKYGLKKARKAPQYSKR